MNDIWRWLGEQFGNILGVLGLVTGFWFFLLSRKPKRFGWQVLTKTQIIAHQSRALPLQVVFNGKEVDNPNIVVLRVGNTGKAEIHARDFDGPVSVEFEKSTLLSASVNRKFDEGITTEFEHDSKALKYTPPMMNAGEWVEFQMVTDGPLETPRVHARIAGQNGPSPDMEKVRKKTWEPVAYVGMSLGVAALPLALVFGNNPTLSWLFPVSAFLGLALLVAGTTQVDRATGWAKPPKVRKSKKA